MGLIPQTFIDELIARTDIVEVIGTRVQLKKAGREFRACCPFHNEKTPSFWVSPDKQFYHCFGCGAHGSVLRFLMEHDRMAFPEAVEELASRLSLEVPHEGAAAPGGARRPDEPLYELMERVAQFYAQALSRDEKAKQYVLRRGLEQETVERFGVGYAPNSWHDVLRRFGTDEASRKQLAELGLIIERDRGQTGAAAEGNRHYDRFRDRLMFPIRDVRGRVIAFGGRVIDQGEPKYLNSPETVLFHKGRELYGLYETRRTRSNLKRLLIVEGYMDAVRLHQAGINYAVATLGTATTPEHFKRVFRLVNEVVFAFDGDRAGRAAAWRALQHALPEAREGREIRFLFLPDGHDPDTLVGEEGAEAFEKRLETTTLPLSEYLIRELSEQADLTHADGMARFAELARPLFAKITEGVYRDLLLGRLAKVIGLAPQRLEQLWGVGEASQTTNGHSVGSAGQREGSPHRAETAQRGGADAGGRGRDYSRRTTAQSRVSAGRWSLVRQAIALLVWFPAIAREVSAVERLGLDSCEEPGVELLRELLDTLRAHPLQVSAQVIERYADKPEGEHLAKLLQRGELVSDAAKATSELKGALVTLGDRAAEQRWKALERKVDGNGGSLSALSEEELQEFQKLMRRRAPPSAQ
ncbi:MAG TPA: DNA primase [Steroidobacteraceae bacterium]|jgi:DNA primase